MITEDVDPGGTRWPDAPASPPRPDPSLPLTASRPRRRWALLGVALVVVALLAGVAGALLAQRDHARLQRLPLPQGSTQLDAGGLDLASLLASAKDRTFHARYVSRVDPQVSGGKLELEWWNAEGRSRVDTVLTRVDDVVRTASISAGRDSVTCQKVGDAPWTCARVARPSTADPAGLVTSLTAQLSGRPVTERPQGPESAAKIGGHDARCFSVGSPGDPIEVCATPEGVMLRVASEQAGYEISALDSDIPRTIFDPPAKP